MPAENLVMISVDDLFAYDKFRDTFGVTIQTPNFDRLAGLGTTFDAAYAATPLCGPSRATILTGQTPFETGIYTNSNDFYDRLDRADLLPTALHDSGMTTGLFGKIFHTHELAAEYAAGMIDSLIVSDGYLKETFDLPFGGPAPEGITDADFADYQTIDNAIDFIAAQAGNRFAVMAGLGRPHVPTVVPQEYFDLYPIEQIVAAGYPDEFFATMPDFAQQFLNGPAPGASAALAIQSYLASISFADAQLGRLLDALDAGGLWDSTTVVLWSDHGYHLGDHDKWGKFTLWEEAANAPLIIVDPGQDQAGVHVSTPVSLPQLFATIMDLQGLATPPSVSARGFAGLISSALGPYQAGPVLTTIFGSLSVRDGDYRMIRYEDGSLELYDLATDPGQLINLAADPLQVDLVAAQIEVLRQTAAAQGAVFNSTGGLISGAEGDDRLIAAGDVTEARGGAGNDTYFISDATQVIEDVDGGRDFVVLRWNGTDDRMQYRLPDNVEGYATGIGIVVVEVTGTVGNNIFIAGKEGERLIARGLGGDDRMFGGTGNDLLVCGTGNDRLKGGAANDVLKGGAGDDTLLGEGGNDILVPGHGNDLISSGSGFDRIVLRPEDGLKLVAEFSVVDRTTPTVAGFDPLQDVLVLNGFAFADVAAVLAAFVDGPEGAVLDAEGLRIVLWGVTASALAAGNIDLLSPDPGPPDLSGSAPPAPDPLLL